MTRLIQRKLSASMIPVSVVVNRVDSPPRNHSTPKLTQRFISSKLIEVIQISGGQTGGTVTSISYTFTTNDLVNRKLTKTHSYGTNELDITIIDNLGKEIEFSSVVTATTVEVDFARANITGNWKLLIEKVG